MLELSPAIQAVRSLARIARVIERASDDLSFADYRVLAAIASGEERASRLATRLALGKPAISSSVDSLGRRGLVVRSSVEGDNRAIALSLSAAGADLLERMEASMAALLGDLADETGDAPAVLNSLVSLGDAVEHRMAQRFAERVAQ
jgi:DNA-binding MarR family transcriptional regulator